MSREIKHLTARTATDTLLKFLDQYWTKIDVHSHMVSVESWATATCKFKATSQPEEAVWDPHLEQALLFNQCSSRRDRYPLSCPPCAALTGGWIREQVCYRGSLEMTSQDQGGWEHTLERVKWGWENKRRKSFSGRLPWVQTRVWGLEKKEKNEQLTVGYFSEVEWYSFSRKGLPWPVI